MSVKVCFAILGLNDKFSMKIVLTYAPTYTHPDEEMEIFYDDISTALSKIPTHFTIIIDNFNAKLGKELQ